VKTVRFIMALHNHQPVGNFDHVIEQACTRAYHPFLDILERFPEIRMVFHYSGPLLEWADRHNPALIERISEGVRANRFELLGGGFGEPILTMLSDADVTGQISLFSRFLRRHCGAEVRGAWTPERVWEPQLASALADAGIEYTVLDDYHFRCAGLRGQELCGYYITEDQGKLLRVFSGSKFLRYAIPFRDPADTIEYLRRFASEDGENVIVYADDGEKFGTWPETYEHVYENLWLPRFMEALKENSDWIRFCTFADVVDGVPPRGRIYLSEASYPEMTAWVLPPQVQNEFLDVRQALEASPLSEQAMAFMRGGFWRNFKVKYVEAAQLYARMMEVSALVREREAARKLEEARRELYRAQCNCAYWHGVFGGLYMPFLRFAVYQHLLRAENLLGGRRRPGRSVQDFDFDDLPEVKLHNPHLNCYLKPDRGGALYELDDRERACNLTAVMTRRPEAYHRRLIEAGRSPDPAEENAEGAVSIHERVRCKEPGLEKLLFYDPHVRECLVDHFYPAATAPEELLAARTAEWGDFASAKYELLVPRARASTVTLRRRGLAGPPGCRRPVILAKRVALGGDRTIDVRYALSFPEGAPEETVFGVEFNLGLMAGDMPDRNYFSHTGENLGNLSTMLRRPSEPALGMVDEWLGVEIWIGVEPAAGFWAHPVETVNDSEAGFERVYQGSAVIPYWNLIAPPGEEHIFTLSLEIRHR